MKVQVSNIVSAVGVLKTIDTTKMKLSTSYKVKKVLNVLQVAMEVFEAKRLDLAKTHGTLSEDGTHYLFGDKENENAFQEGMLVIFNEEIDIDLEKIPLELIDDYVTIEPVNVEFVSWFIEGLE